MMTSYKTNEFEKYVQGCHSVTITIYADFCFSTEYSYLDTIDSLKQAFPLEENDIYFSLAFKKTRRECFKVLSQLCWDEILIDSIIKMPFEMRGIFDELEPTEYSFIERLLMLSGDVELNPGPVHSKSTIPEREFEVNPKFLRKFLKLRKLFLRLQKNNIPSRQIRHNLDKISQIIAQGSTVSQCLSDRIDEVIFENNRVAQIGVPLSHSLSKDTKDYLDDKMQQARSISDKTMETLKDLFTTFKSNLNDQVGSLLESINLTQKILIFLAFSMCIFYLISKFTGLPDITNTTVFGLLIAFVSITVTCPILKETLSKLIEKFKFKRNGNERFAQGDDDSFDFSCLIPPFFLNAIDDGPSATLLNMWNSRHVDLACKRVSYFGDHKLEAGINRIGTWLKEIIEDTINAFKIKVLGRDPAEFVKEKNPLEKWQEECSKYFEADISRLVTYTDSTLSDLQRLYKTGMDYLRHPLYKSDERIIRDAINQIMRFAEKIKSKVGSTSSVRNPPITLYLYGETGVGKSTLTYPLMCLLLKRIFEKEGNKIMLDDLSKTYKEMIYVRASEQEYWDNYKGQLVTVFDDFNQMKDSSSNPSIELFEIIRSSNIFPYPLHMAAIDEKANTNFSSRVILCTSNNKIPKTESLNYPVAMLRRYCKFLEVKRTPTEDGKFSLDSYTFEEYDPLTSPIQGAPVKSLTHSELIDDLVNRYFNDGNFVKSVDDFIQGTIFAQDGEDKNTYISLGDASCGINSAINTVLEQQECEKTFSYRFRQYMDVKRKDLTAKFLKYKEDNDYHVWNSFSKKAAIVLGIVGVISFGVGLYKYFKGNKPSMNRRSFRKSPPPDSDTEVPIVEGYNQKEVKKRVEGYNQKDVKKRVESVKISNEEAAILLKQEGLNIENHGEACLDVNAKEQLNKVVTKNYYLMTVVCGAKEIVIGHCLFIKGTVAIAPFHFARVFDKCYKENNNSTLNFRSAYGSAGFTTFLSDITFYDFTPKNLHPIKSYSRDIMHFSIRKAHVHSDITNFFADRAELRAVGTTQIILPLIKKESSGKVYLSISQTSGSSCIANVQDIDYRVGTDSMETILLRESWEYSLDTVAGDCGAPLFVRNTKVGPGKIIGIHVAGGYSKVGVNANYATPIYKDDVIEIMKHPDYKNTAQCFGQVFREKIIPIGVPECYQDCEFLVHGKASRTVRHATRTQVTPTPLNEKIRECTMKPAWLRPKLLGDEEFDPYMYRTLKFGKKGTPIKQQHVRFARDALVNDLYNKYLQNRNRLEGKFPAKLTFEQAIIGIPGEEFVNAIKRDTSCGYPLTQEKWTRAKIFGNDQEYNLDTPGVEMLRERVSLYEKGASEGVVYDHYFTDCLKDEKKPIEKAHKARMFSNGPVDYLIWSKMYYNPIVAILSELRNDDHISVGTNVYSQDWDHIARLMKAKSNHIIAGDFEGFDSSEQSEILNEVLEVLIELAKKIFKIDLEHEIQMRAIFVSLVNSLHINGDHVIQWLKSLPSGHYLTAIVNSIYVALLMCLVFMDSVNNFSYTIALLFFMLFALVAYGDDHLVAVPERFLEHFNQITLPKIMEQYGMSYTLESKETDVNFKSRTIEQVTYLKRRFLFDEARQIYIAPLDLNVVLEMSMWTKSTKDIALNTRAILDKALLELSLHEEETWNEWKSKLIEAGEEHISYSSPYIHFDDTREEALGCSMQDDFIAQSSQPSDVIFGNTDKLLRSQCNSNCYLMQARSYLGLPAKIERKQPFQYLGKPESVDSFKWTNNSKKLTC
uniref:ORF1_0 protein n=1 Tax=Fopius arisanus TaxID=64838 RepID=A0A0C9RMV9_9HYME